MEAAVKNRWSATVSDMDLYYTGLLDARCALETSFFFLSFFLFPCTTVFLAGSHAVCPFGMAD